MGYQVLMDHNADAEGNYTLVAFDKGGTGDDDDKDNQGAGRRQPGLYPVGTFLLNPDSSEGLPTLQEDRPLVWPRGRPPLAVPICGFKV